MYKIINPGPQTFITGPWVGNILVITGYILLIASVISPVFGGYGVDFFLLGLGGFMVSTYNFISLNDEEDYIFDGVLLFGFFKIGKKYPLSTYPYMALLKKAFSPTNIYAFGDGGKKKLYAYDMYLLSETHLKRLHINRFTDLEEAQEKMEKLSVATGIEIVRYSPKKR
jgi:hypothetical protein